MNLIKQLKKKRRGVSPIIAAILLIGLAVLAGAAIYVVVLPMLTGSTSASDVTASMSGTADTTTSTTQTTFIVTFANKGLKDVNVNITNDGTTTQAVTIGTTSYSYSVSSGGSDVTATGVTVQAGKTTDVTVTVTYTAGSTPSGAIKVNVHIGNPVNSDKVFSLGTI